ncbi:MAG: hypothetical protein ACREQ5_09685, partial [Candidatus Dormibacteria bacterium]
FEKHHVVNESYNDELETDDIVQTMQDNYEELMNKTDPDELDDAILNWLNDELEEHGEFDKMPEDVIRDIYDDYCSLTGEEKPEDVEEATKPTPSIHRDVVWGLKVNQQHPVNSFMDWHDRVEKKGGTETKFKVHNAGNSTSAYRMGKHLGTYHHNKKSGFVNEDTLIESPMHRLNSITRQGEEQDVVFHDGRSARVHPKMAKVVKSLLDKVNSHNKVKLANLINSSPEGLDQVTQFAHSTITK